MLLFVKLISQRGAEREEAEKAIEKNFPLFSRVRGQEAL